MKEQIKNNREELVNNLCNAQENLRQAKKDWLEQQQKEFDAILDDIFHYPMAMIDPHYDFIKNNIYERLKEYRINYLQLFW